MNDDQQKLK